MKLVFSRGKICEMAAAIEIGLAANWCTRAWLHHNSRRRYGDAVLVYNCNGRERGLRGCGAHQDEAEKKSTHALRSSFYVRKLIVRSVFQRTLKRTESFAS